ncbi:hypothetical protein ACT4US_22560, partial [Bacillus sp. HC-Mk]
CRQHGSAHSSGAGGVLQQPTRHLHNAFNQTTSEIAKLVNKSVATVEKLLTLSTANYDVQQEVKSGAVSVDVAVDRVREFGEQAGEVLQHDKAVAAAQGKTKVTRSSIAPELSIKRARRFVALSAQASISDEGVFTLQGTALAEALSIIVELDKQSFPDHFSGRDWLG